MATLKQHQQAMVELLANGSGIPASASRLAHAMHDVLDLLISQPATKDAVQTIAAVVKVAAEKGTEEQRRLWKEQDLQRFEDLLASQRQSCVVATVNELQIHRIREEAARQCYSGILIASKKIFGIDDATTLGLNEKAIAEAATPLKTDSHATRPVSAESRIKELENTIRQLKGYNAKLKADYKEIQIDRDNLQTMLFNAKAGCRKECEHKHIVNGCCDTCGAVL